MAEIHIPFIQGCAVA